MQGGIQEGNKNTSKKYNKKSSTFILFFERLGNMETWLMIMIIIFGSRPRTNRGRNKKKVISVASDASV